MTLIPRDWAAFLEVDQPSNSELSLPKELVRLFTDRPPALFVGAGVSASAGIPTGDGVIQKLKERYPKELEKLASEYIYAEALQRALPRKEQRRRLFELLCAGCSPDKEHHLIAHLVAHKKISIVLTTNFDQLTELALMSRGPRHPRVYLYDDDIEPPIYSTASPKVLKLHGDFLFDDIANLDDELERRLNENMKMKVCPYLERRGLISVGYAGRDETVMKLLMQVAESPLGMKDGLWWVIYNESEKNNPCLISLINSMRENDKRAEIIGPTNARQFFGTLCISLKLGPPKAFPFAIRPKRTLVSSYVQRFVRPRQLPPSIDPQLLDSDRQIVLKKLKRAIKNDGMIWLFGPPNSGKSTVIGKLAQDLDPRRFFYFSHRFAPQPASWSLRRELEGFAGGLGVQILSYEGMLSDVFRKNAVMVFDDLFSVNPRIEISSRLFTDLLQIVRIREQVGRGHLIFVSSSIPKGLSRKRITLIDIESTLSTEKPRVSSLFSTMSLLRVAEYPDVLALLCACPNVHTLLEGSEDDFMDARNGKYVLRDSVQTYLRKTDKTPEKQRPELAKRLVLLADEYPYYRKLHYELEAEHQYRHAEYRRESLLLFLSLAHVLIEWESRDVSYLIFQYYARVALEKSILHTLEPEELIQLLLHYYEASSYQLVTDQECNNLERGIRQVLSERDEGYENLLDASISWFKNDLNVSKQFLLTAERTFREKSNYKVLAKVLFSLSANALEMRKHAFDQHAKLSEEAFLRAQEARSIYSSLSDEEGIARTEDHLALKYLEDGKYCDAIDVATRALHVHAAGEGFTSKKAVVYGNLFIASLGKRDFKSAEGCFHQSNMNYAHRDEWVGILRNYCQLFAFSVANRREFRWLPPVSSLYHVIVESAVLRAATADGAEVLHMAFQANRTWFSYNLRPIRVRSLLVALRDCFRLGSLQVERSLRQQPVRELEQMQDSFYQCLIEVGILVIKVGESVFSEILHAVNAELPDDLIMYACYCDWLINSDLNLDELLTKYQLDSRWKSYFEEAHTVALQIDKFGFSEGQQFGTFRSATPN
jgi:hypothetical protein